MDYFQIHSICLNSNLLGLSSDRITAVSPWRSISLKRRSLQSPYCTAMLSVHITLFPCPSFGLKILFFFFCNSFLTSFPPNKNIICIFNTYHYCTTFLCSVGRYWFIQILGCNAARCTFHCLWIVGREEPLLGLTNSVSYWNVTT